MNFARLAEFIQIVADKSFTKAAQSLHLNPATLSSRQKRFEKTLGFKLFVYQHGQLVLTEAGQNFYHYGLQLDQRYQDLKTELRATNNTQFTKLRIGIVGGVLPTTLTDFFAGIHLRYPHTQFVLSDDTACGLQTGLLTQQVDLYCAPVLSRATWHPALQQQCLFKAHPQVVLPADHRLATAPAVALSMLAQEKFIAYPKTEENCIRAFQHQILAACPFDYTLLQTKSSLSFYQQLISMKKGLLLYPTKLSHLPVGCVQRPLIDTEVTTQYSMFYIRRAKKMVTDFASEILKFSTDVGG